MSSFTHHNYAFSANHIQDLGPGAQRVPYVPAFPSIAEATPETRTYVELTTWAWLIVASVLLCAEILSPGMLALPFAIGAGVAAGCSAAGLGSGWQWGSFVVVSSLLFVIAQRWLNRRR